MSLVAALNARWAYFLHVTCSAFIDMLIFAFCNCSLEGASFLGFLINLWKLFFVGSFGYDFGVFYHYHYGLAWVVATIEKGVTLAGEKLLTLISYFTGLMTIGSRYTHNTQFFYPATNTAKAVLLNLNPSSFHKRANFRRKFIDMILLQL